MAKLIPDAVLDAALDDYGAATEMYICTSQPTDRASAISSAINAAHDITGDFTKANGDTSGRKSTLAAQAVPINANGTATHVAICSGTVLKGVTTCTSTAFTNGDTANVSAFAYEIRDAA